MLVIRRLFGTGTNCIAPSGLPLLLCLFPGLAPWAFLSRPCGASFAPETSLSLDQRPAAQSCCGEEEQRDQPVLPPVRCCSYECRRALHRASPYSPRSTVPCMTAPSTRPRNP